MKHLLPLFVLLLSLVFCGTCGTEPDFIGTWVGDANGIPAVEVVVAQQTPSVKGTIGFWFQTRDASGKMTLGEKTEGAMLFPAIADGVLHFESLHHKKHGLPELGANRKYTMALTGVNEARFHMFDDQPDKTQGLLMVRKR